jgi:hypothetical protein
MWRVDFPAEFDPELHRLDGMAGERAECCPEAGLEADDWPRIEFEC